MEKTQNWVPAWGQAHAGLSIAHFIAKDTTYRLVVNTAISGKALRLRLSNKYGNDRVVIGAMTAALCDSEGQILPDTAAVPLTCQGDAAFTLYAGQRIVSDPAPLICPPDSFLCVSVYVRSGILTSGNGLNSARLLIARGDRTGQISFPHTERTRTKVYKGVMGILRIPQPPPIPLFEDIELDNGENAKAIVCFGDSLTHHGFWTAPFERAIRKTYPGRYTVINKGISGNRLMRGSKIPLKNFMGNAAFERVAENVFDYENVAYAVICIGINDMLQPATIAAPPGDRSAPEEYYEAIEKFYRLFRERGIKTVGMNYVGFGGGIDATKSKNEMRRIVNEWFFEHTDVCDCFVDVYNLFRHPEKPDFVRPEYLWKDNLHPNAKGGEVIAATIPLEIFK